MQVLVCARQLATWQVFSAQVSHTTRVPQLFGTSPHFGLAVPTPQVCSFVSGMQQVSGVQQRPWLSHCAVTPVQHTGSPPSFSQQTVWQRGPGSAAIGE